MEAMLKKLARVPARPRKGRAQETPGQARGALRAEAQDARRADASAGRAQPAESSASAASASGQIRNSLAKPLIVKTSATGSLMPLRPAEEM